MELQQKMVIMTETAQLLIDMIQRRMNGRFSVLNSLHSTPLDNISNEVKMMREIEAKAVRAVMQEQSDIIDIINALFPNVKVAPPIPVPVVEIPDDDNQEIREVKKSSVKKSKPKPKSKKANAAAK
ncbi:MAG TPA: hypothetical protein VN722_08415 [Hanamia sp.]|nr:hypothetical protein [Hanamia sp.]